MNSPWSLVALRALQNGLYVMPLMVVFWQRAGLSLAQVFQLQAIFSAAVLVLEVPTGYLADRVGRRPALVAGYVLWATAYVVYALSGGFAGFIAAELLLAAGVSLASGADTAMLYEHRPDEFPKWQGRVVAAGQISEAAAAVLGGLLAVIDIRLPFWLCAAQLSAAAVLAATLSEPAPTRGQGAQESLGRAVAAPIALFAVVSTATYVAVWLYQPRWAQLDLPLAWFGAAWAACQLAPAAAAWLAPRWSASAGLWTAALLPGIGMLALGATSTLAPTLALCIAVQAARGLNATLVAAELHRRVPSELRATAHSILSAACRLVFLVAGPLVGLYADRFGLLSALQAAGAVFAISGVCVVVIMQHDSRRFVPMKNTAVALALVLFCSDIARTQTTLSDAWGQAQYILLKHRAAAAEAQPRPRAASAPGDLITELTRLAESAEAQRRANEPLRAALIETERTRVPRADLLEALSERTSEQAKLAVSLDEAVAGLTGRLAPPIPENEQAEALVERLDAAFHGAYMIAPLPNPPLLGGKPHPLAKYTGFLPDRVEIIVDQLLETESDAAVRAKLNEVKASAQAYNKAMYRLHGSIHKLEHALKGGHAHDRK